MKSSLISALVVCVACGALAQTPQPHNNGQTVTDNIETTLTISSFTVPADEDRLLVACTTNASNQPAPALTFDEAPMTLAVSRNTTSGIRLSMYYLALGSDVSPTSGEILASGSSLLQLGAASFHDVDQTDPVDGEVSGTIAAEAASSSISISSGVNKLPCDCVTAFANGFTDFTVDPSQTEVFQSDLSSPSTRLAMSTKAGAASTTMGWTINGDFAMGTGAHVGLNISGGPILPVELVSFEGEAIESSYKLHWYTASEVDNSGFGIERSADGREWTSLGFVPKTGSENAPQHYSWADNSPLEGKNYYRLRMLDLDGSFGFSPIITFHHEAVSTFGVYPNPVRDVLFYKHAGSGKAIRTRLYNASGRLVADQMTSDDQVSVSALPAGLYQMVLTTTTGNVYKRFIKQ